MKNRLCGATVLIFVLHSAFCTLHSVSAAEEKFIPPSVLSAGAGTMELKDQATVYGGTVQLKQLCRWSDGDAPAFAQVSDLIIARFDKGRSAKTVTLDDIRTTLTGAGVNLAGIRFCGAMACKVSRSDPADGDRDALADWVAHQQPVAQTPQPTVSPTAATASVAAAPLAVTTISPRTLRDKLLQDISQRLNVPIDDLQVSFDPKDVGLLNLSEPNFHFDIRARNVRNLGDVSWDITIFTEGGQQKVSVTAAARAWQKQQVLTRAVSYRQVLRDEDVEEHRVLTDLLPTDPLLARDQVVNQQAARDLPTGTVMTARLVEAVPLAKTGQFITVTLSSGSVQVTTVARAMEGGSYGQTIRVRNDDTRDVFEVTLTGPQTASMGTVPTDVNLAASRQ